MIIMNDWLTPVKKNHLSSVPGKAFPDLEY